MIEFTDITIIESRGNYKNTLEIMEKDVPGRDWMLETECYINVGPFSSVFKLHFWKNGDVFIWNSPLRASGMDDHDIEAMSRWCTKNGWKVPQINSRLLRTPQEIEYWNRTYLKGFICSEYFAKLEEEEMKRLQEGMKLEGDD